MDRAISSILRKWCDEAGVKTPVGYYKNFSEKYWEIYTDRPGFLILAMRHLKILERRYFLSEKKPRKH